MSKFENFIKSLSNHELAIFVRFSYPGLLQKSKNRIDNEILKRKLTSEELENYSLEKLNANSDEEIKKCPRCGSFKLYKETSFGEIPFNEFSSVEVATETKRCRLCGFNPDKNVPKSLMERIKRKVKNIRNRRFSKWNSI